MLVPEQVYEFTRAQDLASQRLSLVRRYQAVTLGLADYFAATLNLLVVPQDKALILTSFGVWIDTLTPLTYRGLVAFTQTSGTTAVDPAQRGKHVLAATFGAVGGASAALQHNAFGWSGQLMVANPRSVDLELMLAAPPAIAQEINFHVTGIFIPRGNVTEG
jgi:hypothetical protein